jgi:hypothetical protein
MSNGMAKMVELTMSVTPPTQIPTAESLFITPQEGQTTADDSSKPILASISLSNWR